MVRMMLKLTASVAAIALALPATAQEARDLPEIQTGEWGVDLGYIDPSIDPGDDFFGYMNQRWIDAHPIPAQYTAVGNFLILREDTRANVRKLVDDLIAADPAPGTSERRVVDAYKAFLDVEAIDARGLAPAQPYLNQIVGAADLEALLALSASPGYPSFVSAGVTVDPKNPEAHAPTIGFDGMGLPGRDYYLDTNERNSAIQQAYREYLAFMLGKAGYEDPAAAAEAVYAFEHSVAQLEWAPQALRNRDITYNLLTKDELTALVPGFPIERVLEVSKVGSAEAFLVNQLPPTAEEIETLGLTPEYLAGIGGGLPAMMQLLQSTPLPTLKAYLAAHFLGAHAAHLPSDIDQAAFDMFNKTIYGQKEQQPRWKRAIAAVEGQVGELLGASYVERHFPPASKDAMDELVANLVAAMRESIGESDWMSAATQQQALAKLEAFEPRIGYGEEFETYDGLAIVADDPLANAMSAARWAFDDNRRRLDEPVDRSEWPYVPQTVNASYRPNFNQIVFPAGILQPPFFNIDADPAVNYGAIGAVIGHEIGHGFDDQGSKYDGTGALRNWWTDSDREAFEKLADTLVEQYNAYCPLDDGKTCVNGRFTLGENIGDLVGAEMAYRAYKLSLGGKEAPVIDGLTGDQRFFLGLAQIWRQNRTEGSLRNQMLTDPHSPERFRINGTVRNMDAWYEAFNVTKDDALYLPPEERVRIW